MRLIGILISVIIIIAVCTITIRSLNYLIKDATYETYENKCETIYHEPSDRNIILRIDDIQAGYLKDVQMMMISDALNRNKTVSLAVIPIGLFNDKDMVKFLKENKCRLEIGLHGYTNVDYEFLDISYKTADEKIKNGLEILNEIEPEIVTFIPPNNECPEECKRAVYDNGIKIISSGFVNKEFGFSVSTFDWENRTFVDYKEILEECKEEMDKGETCIIMIHPQDYVTKGELDTKRYEEYINLLNGIDELNATVVTFRDMYDKERIKLDQMYSTTAYT